MHDVYNYRFIGTNKVVDLTIPENIILDLLIQKKGDVVAYEEFIKAIYGYKLDYGLIKCINTHIARMNKKLKGEVNIINKRGIGYMIY